MLWHLAILLLSAATAYADSATHALPDQSRQKQMWFGDWASSPRIVSGCAPSVPGALTMAAFACEAYIQDPTTNEQIYVSQAATVAVGPLNAGAGNYWLAIHRDVSTAVAGWTRQAGSHYLWKLSASRPTQPSNSMIFAKVVVTAQIDTITTVGKAQTGWLDCTRYLVRNDNPKGPVALFVNTNPSGPSAGPTESTWIDYEAETFGLPHHIRAINLGGILGITPGATAGTCFLAVSARTYGDTLDAANYLFETIIGEGTTDSDRTNASAWIPVTDGKWQMYWTSLPSTHNYPTNCSHLINLAVQAACY